MSGRLMNTVSGDAVLDFKEKDNNTLTNNKLKFKIRRKPKIQNRVGRN
jgi:hypothetical protein